MGMKSAFWPTALSVLGRWQEDRSPAGRQDDSACDRQAAHDLHRRDRLRQQREGDECGEEGLQVGEQRRSRRADAVDCGEPEQVRDHERPDHGEREADPHERTEVEALIRELPRPRHEQRNRHRQQKDCTQSER
jgi:hypothetical protein